MAQIPEYDTTGKPHPYHIVSPSPWPLLASFAAGFMAISAVLFMHESWVIGADGDNPVNIAFFGIILGLAAVCGIAFLWWRDCAHEGLVEKAHTPITKLGFRYGMALFISSEVMFFGAFFWAFFDAAFYPGGAELIGRTEFTGGQWPPKDVTVINPLDLPFLMTMILLLSGCAVTWAHHAIQHGNIKEFIQGLGVTVALGVIFLFFQIYEYVHAPFGFKDGIYSSVFFMATGFHGFHVLIGTIFLFVCYIKARKNHYTADNHFSFEAAAWYWHFVDVVWLFLFVSVYFWGGMGADHMH